MCLFCPYQCWCFDSNGSFYCANHIVSSFPPSLLSVSYHFQVEKHGGPVEERSLTSFPDEVLSSLTDSERREVRADQFGLLGYRARLYGGDLVRNACRINDICSIDKGIDELMHRSDRLEVVQPDDQPRQVPLAYESQDENHLRPPKRLLFR